MIVEYCLKSSSLSNMEHGLVMMPPPFLQLSESPEQIAKHQAEIRHHLTEKSKPIIAQKIQTLGRNSD